MPEPKVYSLSKAVLIIIVWTLAISGSATVGLVYRQYALRQHLQDPAFILSTVIQRGADRGRLPDAYYGALLGLGSRHAPHAYAFDLETARASLLKSPWLDDVQVSTKLPRTVRIKPRLRKPVARLHNVERALVDASGHIFPPLEGESYEQLAELQLAQLPDPIWGGQINPETMRLAMQLLTALRHDELRCVDVSDIEASSLGRREIVVTLGEETKHYLRLTPSGWSEQLLNYRQLQQALGEQLAGQVIDLRIDHLAYLDSVTSR